MKKTFDLLTIISHLWNSSLMDGSNKFFKTPNRNNNRRVNSRFVSHNMHYLIVQNISAQ